MVHYLHDIGKHDHVDELDDDHDSNYNHVATHDHYLHEYHDFDLQLLHHVAGGIDNSNIARD